MDIKALRKGVREIKKHKYPYNVQYSYGFHDAVEMCNKLIEEEIRKHRKAEREMEEVCTPKRNIHDIVV